MEDRVGAPGAAGLCSDFDAGSIQVESDSGSHTVGSKLQESVSGRAFRA